MTDDNTIFGIRPDFDERLRPTPEDLSAFFESAKKEGGKDSLLNGLASYRELLEDIDGFMQLQSSDGEAPDIRHRIVFGALDHSQLVNPVLLSNVELYAYRLHGLELLDFKSPATFIKSAEHELSRLSTKRINDVMRMERLQEMIAERKKILGKLRKQWMEVALELRRIALYIRENLVRIEKLCEASAVILAEVEIGKTKEKQLIEDVKTYFEEMLKNALQRGQITERNMEKVKGEVELITAEMSYLIREDSDALMRIYEAIENRVKASAQDIAALLADLESKKGGSVLENLRLFERLEGVFVSLLSGCRFAVKSSRTGPAKPRDIILTEKRAEMLDYLFEQVQKERRSRTDRRARSDRRRSNDMNYRGPERRSGRDRRIGKGRRS